jgi:hypothetical protein
MPIIHHPRQKGHVISFLGGMQGEPHKTFHSFLPLPNTLSVPSCQEIPVYGAPGNNNDRMNTMGRVMGGSCLKPCVCGGFSENSADLENMSPGNSGGWIWSIRYPYFMEPDGEVATPTPESMSLRVGYAPSIK